MWGFSPSAESGVLARPGGERTVSTGDTTALVEGWEVKLQKGWSCHCPGVQSLHDTSHPPAVIGHCQEEEMPLCEAAPPREGHRSCFPFRDAHRTGGAQEQAVCPTAGQGGERGQFPLRGAQTPSPSSVPIREWSHCRHEASLIAPVQAAAPQPSAPKS